MNEIEIKRRCKCLKGSKQQYFVKGNTYYVNYLYQDIDGDFMVEAIDGFNFIRQVRATRFNIVMP